MKSFLNLECSLLGILEASPACRRSCSSHWTEYQIQNGSRSNLFWLAAVYLFSFSVHLNSTLIKGDTAPLFLNSWGFWENSEPSGLDRSHLELLQGWIWMKWRSLDNIWSSDWIIGGSLNYKIAKEQNLTSQIPLGLGLEESQITKSHSCAGLE